VSSLFVSVDSKAVLIFTVIIKIISVSKLVHIYIYIYYASIFRVLNTVL
jgi:hypothetical protein